MYIKYTCTYGTEENIFVPFICNAHLFDWLVEEYLPQHMPDVPYSWDSV